MTNVSGATDGWKDLLNGGVLHLRCHYMYLWNLLDIPVLMPIMYLAMSIINSWMGPIFTPLGRIYFVAFIFSAENHQIGNKMSITGL